jgi:hypothetical protein
MWYVFGRTRMPARLTIALAAALSLADLPICASKTPTLDYEFFKANVEPIFLKKREGHTRCYVCHEGSNNAFRLEKLPAGAAFWTEEQSRKNFDIVSALVVPGDPANSRLLLQPLAPEAGGNTFHSGGRQFASKNDPDWKTLAQWVTGQTAKKE